MKSRHNDVDSSIVKPISEFELPQVNGEQISEKGRSNKLLTTNFTVEIHNQKVEQPITYSLDQQIFKFKVTNGLKEPQETSNSDKMTNSEL